MSLFVPDGFADALAEVSAAWLEARGVRGILLDLDDTLVPADGQGLDPAAAAWVRAFQEKGAVAIVSNNSRLERVAGIAQLLDVPYVHLALKPLPAGLRRGVRLLGLSPREVAVLGDQIFTDVLGGRWLGLHTVLVSPLSGPPRHPVRRAVRYLERRLLAAAPSPPSRAGGPS
ncbi:MAG: YqeG family HAD IIIA-type phosphatase [Candidatus Sericytochromatia bacterium]|nr:YqeG family HAD IIIA-type phosphatase [Candidatus Sericytochromatia bacterium]